MNRTIRNGLKRERGPFNVKLKRILKIYNEIIEHRGVGMTPTEAKLSKNRDLVKERFLKYKEEFKKRNLKSFELIKKYLLEMKIEKIKWIVSINKSDEFIQLKA
ncbi:hypothetical protein DMUE_2532 [Dictyocoela muelleri]|nr:hypothetical protein DMUE_2532 [Dictyocoela muelleri]